MKHDNDYLWDGSGPVDPEVKRLEELLGQFRADPFASPLSTPERRPVALWIMLPIAAAATFLIAIFGGRDSSSSLASNWTVQRVTGAPTIDAERILVSATAGEGTWIETDDSSEAVITVGTIGRVQVEPNSRVQLIRTRERDHRLSLTKGTVQATTWAPPRLFFVETPSATAIDLGCTYTLTVDERGNGRLCVTAGQVALERESQESVVPSGTVCETRTGIGPGTPYFGGSSDEFRAALARFDFEGASNTDLEAVLHESNMCELFTLWRLLQRVPSSNRAMVFDRMAQILPPPAGVTREGVLALDQGMLAVWETQFSRDEFMPCLTSCTAQAGAEESAAKS